MYCHIIYYIEAPEALEVGTLQLACYDGGGTSYHVHEDRPETSFSRLAEVTLDQNGRSCFVRSENHWLCEMDRVGALPSPCF